WRTIYKRVANEEDRDYMQGLAVSCDNKWADKVCGDWRTGSVSVGDWELVGPFSVSAPIHKDPSVASAKYGI
ncbi:hypothetical protein BGZ50_008027, partial [Haplosporangium sp. Z 11]